MGAVYAATVMPAGQGALEPIFPTEGVVGDEIIIQIVKISVRVGHAFPVYDTAGSSPTGHAYWSFHPVAMAVICRHNGVRIIYVRVVLAAVCICSYVSHEQGINVAFERRVHSAFLVVPHDELHCHIAKIQNIQSSINYGSLFVQFVK